jgi:hypothetical protein
VAIIGFHPRALLIAVLPHRSIGGRDAICLIWLNTRDGRAVRLDLLRHAFRTGHAAM